MDEKKYEKIDGWQALEQLKDGKLVFTFHNNEFSEFMMAGGTLYSSPVSNKAQLKTLRTMTIDAILHRDWYIPKPFDVRQAMLDRPNEWVGALESGGRRFKIGFDTEYFVPVIADFDVPKEPKFIALNRASKESLDACIPIEDLPEEATR